jgi:hypothetical protein
VALAHAPVLKRLAEQDVLATHECRTFEAAHQRCKAQQKIEITPATTNGLEPPP